MRLAVFDPVTLLSDPAGSCTVRAIQAVAEEHQVTVFSSALDPCLDGLVDFVRVPAIARPQVARYLSFRILATLAYLRTRLRRGRFDLVQATETCVRFADLYYVHFCHTAYLRLPGVSIRPPTLRSAIRELDHRVRARAEPRLYRRGRVVAVSRGLAEELRITLGLPPDRVSVINNPVDLAGFSAPGGFDRDSARAAAGVQSADDLLLAFVALGHFERKGLPETLRALAEPDCLDVRLVVVGGTPDLVALTRKQVAELGLSDRVTLVGFQDDIRPWLWAADGFLLPSRYEAFSLVLQQAAAAGLPLLATPVHGVSDLLTDGLSKITVPLVDGTPQVDVALTRFAALSRDERLRMGAAARASVEHLDVSAFGRRWADFYRELPPRL